MHQIYTSYTAAAKNESNNCGGDSKHILGKTQSGAKPVQVPPAFFLSFSHWQIAKIESVVTCQAPLRLDSGRIPPRLHACVVRALYTAHNDSFV